MRVKTSSPGLSLFNVESLSPALSECSGRSCSCMHGEVVKGIHAAASRLDRMGHSSGMRPSGAVPDEGAVLERMIPVLAVVLVPVSLLSE